jgi:hypothetical protein
VFRDGQKLIVTAGNFTSDEARMSVKIKGKYLNITAMPHSFNTYVIGL